MTKKKLLAAALIVAAIGTGAAYALTGNPRTPVEFYTGHTHGADGVTVGAPQHSGGTDAYGCHNASQPYHCH